MTTVKNLWLKRAAVAVSGVVLFTAGIFRGELAAILQKAIYICLECIGIG